MVADPALVADLAAAHRAWSAVIQRRAAALDAALRMEGMAGITYHGGFFTALPDPGGSRAKALRERGVYVVPLPDAMRVGLCAMREDEAPAFAAALRAAGG